MFTWWDHQMMTKGTHLLWLYERHCWAVNRELRTQMPDTSKSASSIYTIINKQYHFMTSDRFRVPVRSAVKSLCRKLKVFIVHFIMTELPIYVCLRGNQTFPLTGFPDKTVSCRDFPTYILWYKSATFKVFNKYIVVDTSSGRYRSRPKFEHPS